MNKFKIGFILEILRNRDLLNNPYSLVFLLDDLNKKYNISPTLEGAINIVLNLFKPQQENKYYNLSLAELYNLKEKFEKEMNLFEWNQVMEAIKMKKTKTEDSYKEFLNFLINFNRFLKLKNSNLNFEDIKNLTLEEVNYLIDVLSKEK